MTYVWQYLVAAGLFVAFDAIWLTTMVKRFYRPQMEKLIAAQPDLIAAGAFYSLYIFGIIVFVVTPALARDSLSFAVSRGALLGLLMYATYDLTNQATLKGWPLSVTLVDMAWGTFVTCLVATITFLIFR
jgi:uncharacterized membrane protein